jgi:hypothetical protein
MRVLKSGLDYLEVLRAPKIHPQVMRRNGWAPGKEIRIETKLSNSIIVDYWCNVKDGYEVRLSITDQLATDWEIVMPEPKTMSFCEAWSLTKQYKKIAQLEWPEGEYATVDNKGRLIRESTRECRHGVLNISKALIDATDWYVVEH